MTENKVLIIAEAGVNHNGDINLAKQLIDVAAEAGADYVKFQTWVTDELIERDAPKALYQSLNDGESSQYEMLKRLELSFGEFRILRDYADKKNIHFLSTPDDFSSLDFLSDVLDLPLIKVGSGEITNLLFLKKIGSKKKEVILSTGMSNIDEVSNAYNALINSGARSVALLHCTSNYPASLESVNLKAINHLQQVFKTEVGYSDHTIGSETAIAAVALGATIIEKHFTLDKSLPGPDHKASLDPAELKRFVNHIRNVEKALSGSGKKEIQPEEIETKKVVTKGVYLIKDIRKGQVITESDVTFKRPVKGISADQIENIFNREASKDLVKGQPLNWEDLLP